MNQSVDFEGNCWFISLGHLALDFQCLLPVCGSPVVEFVNMKMSKPECISDYNLSK